MNLKPIYTFFLLVVYFLIYTFLLPNHIYSASKGEVLEKFTEKQYDLLFNSDLSDVSNEYGDIFSISNRVEVFSGMADGASKKRKGAEETVKSILNQITDLEQSIKVIDHQIVLATEELAEANKGIVDLRKKMNLNQIQIEIMQKKVETQTQTLIEYLEYIYKKSNTSFEEGELDNIKSILLNNEDISDLLNDLYFNSLMQVTGQKLIKEHKELIVELYQTKVQLDKEKREYVRLRKEQILLRSNLHDKKDFKKNLLEISKGQQKVYQKYLDDQIETEKRLKDKALKEQVKLANIKKQMLSKYDCDFVDVSKNTAAVRDMKRNSPKCFSINNMIYSEKQLSDIGKMDAGEAQRNPFSWPVSPRKGVTAFFHDPEYEKLFGAEHNAIDIRASQGTPIRAPMDGYVLYVNKPETLDYSFVAVKHYDGYITVYGHLSEVMVEQYDFVSKGEVFAKTGGEYGTKGAGYITTGPHLHFEVFHNKEYIDPLQVLDVSYLPYEDLPSEGTRFKYLFDFRERKGYDYKSASLNTRMFHIEGANEIERQQYFLKTYARRDFADWQMWIDESLAGDIDPSLTMCIGLAESSLGKNLTTAYNIGNVGNNDRGDRVGVSGPQAGIRSIVSTLNNKYFARYEELDRLSGAGRIISGLPGCKTPGEYCYATDTRHWHPNVVRCLSHLKGEIIPNDYNFRLK